MTFHEVRFPASLSFGSVGGHPVFIETHDGTDHVADPGRRDTLDRLGIRAGAVLPLRLGNRSIGAMTLTSSSSMVTSMPRPPNSPRVCEHQLTTPCSST